MQKQQIPSLTPQESIPIIKTYKIQPAAITTSSSSSSSSLSFSRKSILIPSSATAVTLPTPMSQMPQPSLLTINKIQQNLNNMPIITAAATTTTSNFIFSRTNISDSSSSSASPQIVSVSNIKPTPITVVVTSVASKNSSSTNISSISTNNYTTPTSVGPASGSLNNSLIFPSNLQPISILNTNQSNTMHSNYSSTSSSSSVMGVPKLSRFQQLPKDTIIKQLTSSPSIDFKKIVYPRPDTSIAITPITNPHLTIQQIPQSINVGNDQNSEQKIVFANLFNKAIISGAKEAIQSVQASSASAAAAISSDSQKEMLKKLSSGGGTDTDHNNLVNVQISNGKIVNSKGIIKMLSNTTATVSRASNYMQPLKPSATTIELKNSVFGNGGNDTMNEQIMLKNKLLDNVKRSPRMQVRSKSLTTTKRRRRRPRLPSAPIIVKCEDDDSSSNNVGDTIKQLQNQSVFVHPDENNIKTLLNTTKLAAPSKLNNKKTTNDLNIVDASLSNLCDSLFDSLQCPEKLYESDKSDKSKSLSPIDSLNVNQMCIMGGTGTSGGINVTEKELKMQPANVSNSNSTSNVISTNTNIINYKRDQDQIYHRDDPWKYIKWHSGIGYLSRSNVHFKTNEFDLIEILDETDFSRGQFDVAFQKQLNNDCELIDMGNFPYICKICYRGSTSDLCSIECYSKCNETKIESYSSSTTTNSSDRMKRGSRSRLIQGKQTNRIGSGSGTGGASLLKSSSTTTTTPLSLIDSMHIKTEKKHQQHHSTITPPPSSIVYDYVFNWETYLKSTNSQAAPVNLFINPFPSSKNQFEVNMKVEAIDPFNASVFCVCSIVEILGYRIRLHFDGYPAKYDFWKNADSLDIFPPGWCARNGHQLQPPKGHRDKFEWIPYLLNTKSQAAPRIYFTHLNSSVSDDGVSFNISMQIILKCFFVIKHRISLVHLWLV